MPRISQRSLLRFLLILSVVLAVHFSVQALFPTDSARRLPKTADEAIALEGTHVVVERGSTPSGGSYRVEVSRSRDGDRCSFLHMSPPRTMSTPGQTASLAIGGGGGCSAAPLSYSISGGIVGTTDSRITRVDIVGVESTTTVKTRALPPSAGEGRYFVVLLPVSLVEIEGRDASGELVARVPITHPRHSSMR